MKNMNEFVTMVNTAKGTTKFFTNCVLFLYACYDFKKRKTITKSELEIIHELKSAIEEIEKFANNLVIK